MIASMLEVRFAPASIDLHPDLALFASPTVSHDVKKDAFVKFSGMTDRGNPEGHNAHVELVAARTKIGVAKPKEGASIHPQKNELSRFISIGDPELEEDFPLKDALIIGAMIFREGPVVDGIQRPGHWTVAWREEASGIWTEVDGAKRTILGTKHSDLYGEKHDAMVSFISFKRRRGMGLSTKHVICSKCLVSDTRHKSSKACLQCRKCDKFYVGE